ncbi:YlqD family protein [Bacillus timonensis]|nr:YlqD family protein [Bacillus timonensis]
MKILQNIIVKQILTENSKGSLISSLTEKKNLLQNECDQLLFELKKNEKSKKFQSPKLQLYYNKEIDARLEKIKIIDFQLEQIHMLPLGSEIKEKEVQGIVEVNVGDRWENAVDSKTIIIKEGIIEDIR